MSPTIQMRRIHEWALLPEKHHVDRTESRLEAKYLADNFRYQRAFRRPEACPPWVLGQEAGWVLRAPISVTLDSIFDVQVSADEDLATAGRLLGVSDFWQRGDGYIGAAKTSWLRSHQYRGAGDAWESMFVPNGAGTAEWHLGFGLQIPDGYFLLISGLDGLQGLDVPTGVLTQRQVNRTWESVGFSIAIRPTTTLRLERGQPFARLLLLHQDSLQASAEEAV